MGETAPSTPTHKTPLQSGKFRTISGILHELPPQPTRKQVITHATAWCEKHLNGTLPCGPIKAALGSDLYIVNTDKEPVILCKNCCISQGLKMGPLWLANFYAGSNEVIEINTGVTQTLRTQTELQLQCEHCNPKPT